MKITESSIIKISYGMLATMGAGLVAFIVFLATLDSRVSAHDKAFGEQEKQNEAYKADQKAYAETLNSINTRLAVIEFEVKRLRPRPRPDRSEQ